MFSASNTDEIKRKNLYEAVTDKIEYMLIDGVLPLGTKLPSEQAMADHFGVSRNVIREAYKTLRERGLIEVRNGEGAVVTKPELSMLTDMFNRMLALKSVDFKELYELRSALESNACKLFIKNMTGEKLEDLQNIVDKMKDNMHNREEWVQLDLDFHRYIIKATGNEIFNCFYKPIQTAIRYIFTACWEVPEAKEKGIRAHQAILKAFAAGDERAASECMERHLFESLSDIETVNKTPDRENDRS